MNFSTPQRVLQCIRQGDSAEWERGKNRCAILNSANCVPPFDSALAKKMGLKVNVNFGDLMVPLSQAYRQYRTAVFGNQHFFKVTLPYAPAQYQSDWGYFITDEINRKLRDKQKYFDMMQSVFISIVVHGIAPRIWYDKKSWCPDYVAVEDLRIPTDTYCDLENLGWYAVRHIYTPGELMEAAFVKNKKGWNQKAVADLLRAKKNINTEYPPNNYEWDSQVEKFADLWKQDGGWYSSDAMPGIPLWHFFFEDNSNSDESKRGWYMRIVPAQGSINAPQDKFIWQSDEPVAKKRSQLLHLQYGDLSFKAPPTYHAVRSLGFALLEPTFYSNLTRCKLLQHVYENFDVWLRSADPADRARAMMQEFGNYKIIKPGLGVVPEGERHQIQNDLVESALSQTKQLTQEASASYTQSTDTGTQREQTAFETSVKVEQVTAMLGGLLVKYFETEKFFHREICRRFTMTDTEDEDIKDVQDKLEKAGIPVQFRTDVKQWVIEEVSPLGMGNPTLAKAAAKELAGILPLLDPTAQQEAKHEIVLAITQDPRKAARWVPLNRGRGVTDGQRDAQSMFGTLMQGVEVPSREGLPAIDQVEAMLPLLSAKITMLEQRDNMATIEEAHGLGTVADYIQKLVAQIGQDPNEKERVKRYNDVLGQLMNRVKGLAQRGAEAHAAKSQQQNGHSPELAKVQSTIMLAGVKAATTAAKAKQTAKQKDESFVKEQRRKDAETFANIQREDEMHKTRMKSLQE